jgi:hypothetical protein
MSSIRRYLTFSLRSLFVTLTAAGVSLGSVVNRAREQIETVKVIEEMGGFVLYDWHFDAPSQADRPQGPEWLQRLIGDEFFQEVDSAAFPDGRAHPSESEPLEFLPRLKQMRGLKTLFFWSSMSDDAKNAIKSALPRCRIKGLEVLETHPLVYSRGFEPPPGPGMLSLVIESVKRDRSKNPTGIGP